MQNQINYIVKCIYNLIVKFFLQKNFPSIVKLIFFIIIIKNSIYYEIKNKTSFCVLITLW